LITETTKKPYETKLARMGLFSNLSTEIMSHPFTTLLHKEYTMFLKVENKKALRFGGLGIYIGL